MSAPGLAVSVVSHGQAELVVAVAADLARHCSRPLHLVITSNIPERLELRPPCENMLVERILNDAPRGFGANHNAAFRRTSSEFFCVLNPDIRLDADPFAPLLEALGAPRVAAVAPLILGPEGNVEDSARRFPTPLSILRKAAGRDRGPDYDVAAGQALPVDWVAGMFMLFRSDAFRHIGGFDERYFLYYEDADICRRLRRAGFEVRLEPRARATHFARRTSHRNPRYLRWHVASMLRFFLGA